MATKGVWVAVENDEGEPVVLAAGDEKALRTMMERRAKRAGFADAVWAKDGRFLALVADRDHVLGWLQRVPVHGAAQRGRS